MTQNPLLALQGRPSANIKLSLATSIMIEHSLFPLVLMYATIPVGR